MYSEPYDVYRGVVKIRAKGYATLGHGPSGILVDMERYLYTKTYTKPGTARGQATILRKAQRQSDVIDVWVEKATTWESIDKDC